MTDSEHGDLRRWLADDPFVLNTVLLVAASSLAIALTSCLWHHMYPLDLGSTRSSSPQQSLSAPSPSLSTEHKDHKSTRSKERRRRGKDPFRDLLKGGKKSKALFKAFKAVDHDHTSPSADTLSNASALGNDTPSSSTSRSQSPGSTDDPLDLDRLAPHIDAESDDGSSAKNSIQSGHTPVSAVASSGVSDYSASDMDSLAVMARPRSCPPGSRIATDTEMNISYTSTIIDAPEPAPSSPPLSVTCAGIRTPQPCDSQTATVSESCVKLVRSRTRIRASKIEQSVKPSESSTANDVAASFPCIYPTVPCPSLSIAVSTCSTDGAGPSTPTNPRESPPPSQPLSPPKNLGYEEPPAQPLDPSVVTAQTQLASMRDALEAARMREEQLRAEAEQASKERVELCWRWNEDTGAWRRREAELQAHIHHLVQQLQAYAAAASYHAQQASNLPSSGFSSPTSPHAHSSPRLQHHTLAPFPLPPVIQTQNSASAPAHVQALLASAPMLTCRSPGFAAHAPGGLYSGAGLGMSPLFMGLCVPDRDPRHNGRQTPDSSVSGSSSRGRRRRRRDENVKSTSDESSLGDWDGMEDGSEDEDPWEAEEDDDIFRNSPLADAILKHPESIRGLSASARKRSGVERGEVQGTVLKDPALNDTPAVAQ